MAGGDGWSSGDDGWGDTVSSQPPTVEKRPPPPAPSGSTRTLGRGRARVDGPPPPKNNSTEHPCKLTFSIGARDVPKLIGRAGATIKDLRTKSGCSIQIGEESDNRRLKECEIEVNGPTDAACKKAEEMIYDALGYNKGFYDQNNNDDEVIDWGAMAAKHEEEQKKRWAKCPTLIKSFYTEHPEVTEMTKEAVDKFREDNNKIQLSNFDKESSAPLMNPVPKFEHAFSAFPEVMATINKQGFQRPSPIQAQAWPYLLSGKDMIGIAQTGTGKTLAFLMPAFIHIDGQPVGRDERGGANVLVLCPTRELALQIEGEVAKYEYRGIKSVCVYGGGDRKKQMKVVTEGVQIIIATPGRLNDLVEAGCIKVESITYLVLDEADRMLDMGFEPQIRKILLDIRPDRQTIMTSATWPPGVRRMATQYMNDPVTVFIGSLDLKACQTVTQQVLMIEGGEEEKRGILTDFIVKMDPSDKVMVFVGKKSRADDISSDLSLQGIDCQCIHGDREQSDREQALLDLKTGEVRILIATDVASRGIDIHDITHVINFDFPGDIEDYVHRVGRTGRAGRSGTAITMMEPRDRRQAGKLIDILQKNGQEVPQQLVEMDEKYKRYLERTKTMGNGCFKCGGSGHISRECGGGGGGGGRSGGGGGFGMGALQTSFMPDDGRFGKGLDRALRDDRCFGCGKPGHIRDRCPEKSGGRRGKW